VTTEILAPDRYRLDGAAPEIVAPALHAEGRAIMSGGRRGSHPPAPTERSVTVSRYPALVILIIRQWGHVDPGQWAKIEDFSGSP
jgi:hypothetical protein